MKIHFISIGGSVMHQLAIAVLKRGDVVSGSDDEIFEPARSNLVVAGIFPEAMGWYPQKISRDIDAVILGMHAREDNPELEKAQSLDIPVYSFPEFIYEVSKNKKRVAIGGSHGKTTTTAMIMHILKAAEFDFDYLVGAGLEGFSGSVRISEAPVFISEADEYPASAVEKKPKFLFLHPHIVVITGIAWDHINVFPTFENYRRQFLLFIEEIEECGVLIYNQEDEVLRQVVMEMNRKDLRLIPYGTPHFKISDGKTIVDSGQNRATLKIFGRHNLQNMQAASIVCRELGISEVQVLKAMATFSGASQRLQLIFADESTSVYRDFAHAPSKVKASVDAVKSQFSARKLIAILELHTFSSLNEKFMEEYNGALELSDAAIVFYSKHALELKRLPPLDPEIVKSGFGKKDLIIASDKNDLANQLNKMQIKKTNFLFMSSGNFENLDILNTLHLELNTN